jgi:intein/homing endonuclease
MEENKQNFTVWQRLSRAFGPNSLLNQDYPTYKIDKEVLLKTDDKAEYERQKLQAQQTMYLSGQWSKIENNLYTQAVYYEPTRLASFYDFESMEYSIAGDTKIATPNGFITIKELADKGRDYEFITYAYDHNLKKVVPAKARNAHYTRDEMTYKITFDDDSYIIATHGHRFLKRDGTFCVVEELNEGDSMMPFYRKSFYNNQNYNWVYSCNSSEGHHGWVTEHDLIAEWFNNVTIGDDEEVHHIDFNGKNNMPENLQIMKISEHRAYHARLNNIKLWSNPEYREKMSEVAKRKGKIVWGGRRAKDKNPAYIKLDFNEIVNSAKIHRTLPKTAESLNVSIRKIQNELRFNGFKNWFDFLEFNGIKKYVPQVEDRESLNFKVIPWDLLIEVAKINKTYSATAKALNISLSKLRSTLRMGGYNTWVTFMEAYGLEYGRAGRKKPTQSDTPVVNHKIKSIVPYGVIPVYDLTVPGYKNFATDTIFSHNTPEISAALDIYAEESTTSDRDGIMLRIYSESKRIKSILDDLFNNSLDINTNLPMWIRNMPIREDSVIPLLDGTECTIKELSNRIKSGEEIWSYAVQDNTKAIVPSKIVWCDLTRKNSELYRVTLDDGTYIDSTPDHQYMLRDGSFKRADELTEGQSLMSFSETEKQENDNKTKVINHKVISVVKLEDTADVYCLEAVGPNGEHDRHNFPVLGKDLNDQYSRSSGVFLANCKFGDNFVFLKLDPEKGVVGCMQLPNIEIERLEKGMAAKSMNAEVDPKQRGLKFNWKTKDMEFNSWEVAHFRLLGDDRKLPYGTSMLEKARRIWKQLMLAEDAMLIYRTSRAPERRVFKVFVGNMDDKDVEPYVQRVANKFKRDQVVDSKTGNVDMRYNQMAVDQDYFIPVRDPAQASPIETLPGATNLSEIADIEYIQKKLVTALRIPKAYLGFEEALGDGKNLSLLDIRFARTINKIQKSIISELNKIAIIHLFLLGFEDELSNFVLGLTNPSKQADLLMVEVWKEKVALYKELVTEVPKSLQATSATWAKKHIFNFSDEEIKLDVQQIRLERAISSELDNTPTIITKTGFFDTVDKLYKPTSGVTQQSSEQPAETPDGGGELPPMGETLPENKNSDNLNLLLENDDILGDTYFDLSKGNNSLGLIENELSKILKD